MPHDDLILIYYDHGPNENINYLLITNYTCSHIIILT